MTKTLARTITLIAATVLSMTALSAVPAQADTGPVPDEWGEPTFSGLLANVTARHSGTLPGRLGNQHVITIHIDDDDFMSGHLSDWKCPSGMVPPLHPGDIAPTPCKLKADENFDYAGTGDYTYDWSPTARWVNIQMPIAFTYGQQGHMSLRLKATEEPQVTWADTDGYREAVISRDNASVVGGKFLGKTWLGMDEVSTTSIGVLNVYNSAV